MSPKPKRGTRLGALALVSRYAAGQFGAEEGNAPGPVNCCNMDRHCRTGLDLGQVRPRTKRRHHKAKPRCLLAPEVLEPRRRQFRVTHRVLDVAVPKVGLQGACVVAFVGQGKSAGVPEHVRVRLEPELGLSPGSLDHASEAGRRERCPLLRGEHEGGGGLLLALEPP